MRKMMLLVLAIGMFTNTSMAQEVPSVMQIMDEAFAKAKKENKNVFLIFSGLKCLPCKRLDSIMTDPEISKYFTDNYVVTHLMYSLTNQIMDKEIQEYYKKNEGPAFGGLPYWVVLDNNNGKILGSCNIRKSEGKDSIIISHLGFPRSIETIEHFKNVLSKTSKIDAEGLATIGSKFKKYVRHTSTR